MSDTSLFNWTPERIVVPHGTPDPFDYWDDDSICVSSVEGEGANETFDDHIAASLLRDVEGEYADAAIVIDFDEVPDAQVWYVWRRGPFQYVHETYEQTVVTHMYNRILGAFFQGFIQSRVELPQQRYPDREFETSYPFNAMPFSPDSLSEMLNS